MSTVVVDSNNLEAQLIEAGVTPVKEPEKAAAPPDKAEEPKKVEGETQPEADDVEGEDGLTPRQKRELTDKMLKAIGKKHREAKEAEEFAAAQYSEKTLAEQRAERAEREIERLKAQQETKKETPKAEPPKRESYPSDEEFRKAEIRFEAMKIFEEEKAKALREAEEERHAQVIETAKARIAKAKELKPDFNEVVSAAKSHIPDEVAGYMQESELMAELAYHLAKNPDITDRLQKMKPARALVEIGKIESKLQPFGPASAESEETSNGIKPSSQDGNQPSTETGSTPSKPRVTAPVIKPLNVGSASQVEKPESEQSYQEAKAAWLKRNKANLGLRKRH